MLSVVAGCAQRHPILVAAPPHPLPPPAINQRTLIETPPPSLQPEPPLPALKPATELSLAESEALADNGLAPGTHGHLLVDDLDDLLAPAPPPLDRQHGI